jgi:trans-aconitate methyltransferase
MPTWDAKQYLRFNDPRPRPCRELAARIAMEVPGNAEFNGCGQKPALRAAFDRRLKLELHGSKVIPVAFN